MPWRSRWPAAAKGIAAGTGGGTFRPVPGAPELLFVDWRAAGFYGLDAAGAAWASPDGGTTWQRRGELGSRPAALTVTEAGRLFAAKEEAVVTSRDGGRTFGTVTSYTTVAH